jgi:acetyltransferase-like isoleucine patch superfamily enzyme
VSTHPAIHASLVSAGKGLRCGAGVHVQAQEVVIGDDVVIEDDVRISADRVEIGSGTRIGTGARVVCPDVRIGDLARIGPGLEAEINDHLRLGRLSDVGRGVRMVAQGVDVGDHLWMTDGVSVGGGGARGPRSYLAIGDRSAVMDRCFINVSEPVTIGSDTALSNGVTILTHSLWQPVLAGGTAVFAPTRVGSRNIVYVNAVIAPGVTTGNDVTVAAGALVLQDVPDGATAVGNPARILKSTPPVPRELDPARRDALVREIWRSYAETLPIKGVVMELSGDPDLIIAVVDGTRERIQYLGSAPADAAADVTIGFGSAPHGVSRCHFDLAANAMTGEPTRLSEDLRDHLRRHTIRIFTDRPFQALPPANVARLRARTT